MKKKIAAAAAVATAALTLGLSGVASAEQPNRMQFGKANEDCSIRFTVIAFSGAPHWSKDFNPSDVNEQWRLRDCGAPTTVVAGADVLAPS